MFTKIITGFTLAYITAYGFMWGLNNFLNILILDYLH